MGNSQAKADVEYLTYGTKQLKYHIGPVLDFDKRGPHGAVFRPILRIKPGSTSASPVENSLELAYTWSPATPDAWFEEGAALRHRKGIPEAVRELLIRCMHAYDGREEILFAAGVEGDLDSRAFRPPTLLVVTALGAVLVIRTSTKAGYGAADLEGYFHVLHLKAVNCTGPSSGVLTFQRPAALPLPQNANDPQPVGGKLNIRMPKDALAQLLSSLHLALAVVGGLGSAPEFTAVPAVADVVWTKCYWTPPQAPSDGGFACAFAASCASEGRTARREKRQTLGRRYFESVALLRLDLTDVGPMDDGKALRAASHAWQGNRTFRAFSLQRRLVANEMELYAEGIRSAPLLEVDFGGAHLRAEEVRVFAEAVRSNPFGSLLSLNFSGADLAGEAGVKLAEALDLALPPEHSLRQLRLAGCSLQAASPGGAALLSLLGRRCSRLEVIDLSANRLADGLPGDHPALAALGQIWLSPALREARFANTGLPLAAALPQATAGSLGKRPSLTLDLSGCTLATDSLERFAGLFGDVKDLSVTMRGLAVPRVGWGPVAMLLSMAGEGPPRRSMQIDALDLPGGPEAALRGAAGKLQPQASLTLGFSDAVEPGMPPSTLQENAAQAFQALTSVAPRALQLKNVYVCESGQLNSLLRGMSSSMAGSYDPKELDIYGVSAMLALGITIAKPKRMVQKANFHNQIFETPAMKQAADGLRKILEASTGLESLAVTGSLGRQQTAGCGQVVVRSGPPPCICGEIGFVYGGQGSNGNLNLPDSAGGGRGAGPLLAIGLQGLALNRTLLELDVSFNFMGDFGAVTLGWALRQNRTLRSLNLDGNFITPKGWSSFRGCLYGNKRLTQFVFPQADVDWYTKHLGTVISTCNHAVLQAKAGIKRAYKSTKGHRTARVMQIQNQQVEVIKAAKIQMGNAKRMHAKLTDTQRDIMNDIRRNKQLAAVSDTQQKASRPLWADARGVLRRMAKLQEKRAATLEAEKATMWQRRNELWKMWCEKVYKLASKEKDEQKRKEKTSWFNAFRKEKLQMATGEDGSVNQQELSCLLPHEAQHLLSIVPEELREALNTEIVKTKGGLAKEREMEAKLEGLLVTMESEKLALQEITRDPAWAPPTEASGFADVADGLRHFGLDQALALPSLPPPSLLQAQALAPAPPADAAPVPVAAPAPAVPVVQALPVGPLAGAPVAQAVPLAVPVASPFSPPTQPVVQGVVVGGPTQAALHYDMYQLHNQRAQQYARQQQGGGSQAGLAVGLAMLWQQENERRRRRQREEEEERERRRRRNMWSSSRSPGFSSGPDFGYGYGYGYGGFGYPGWGMGPWGFGSPWPHHHHHWDPFGDINQPPTDWQPVDPGDHIPADAGRDIPTDPGDPGDHGGDPGDPGDQGGDPGDPGDDGDHGFDPDIDPGSDPGDHDAADYGAGGEEPPLPDGGGDDPAPAPAVRAPPVRFRMPPRRWRPLVRDEQPYPGIDSASLLRAELRAMGGWFGTLDEDLPYVKERDVLGSRGAAEAGAVGGRERICLTTQCSADRLGRLREQCLAWAPGDCSVAVFLQPGESREQVMDALTEIEAACSELGGSLIASLVYALPPASGAAAAYDRLYPANALRNVAMDEAVGDFVLVLDVDFVPSRGLHAALLARPGGLAPLLEPAGGPACALVVPALEVQAEERPSASGSGSSATAAQPLPRNFSELNACGERVSAFHSGHFPKGHGATDFPRWTRLSLLGIENREWSYEVQYEEYFEPYVVISRKHAPRFDERFRGYGLNKCSFLRHWHALGHRFEVLAQGGHFVVAAEHPRSEAWRRNYGPEADPREPLKLALLWRLFLRGLPDAERDATGEASAPPEHRTSCLVPMPASLCRAAAVAVAAARRLGPPCGVVAGPSFGVAY